LSKRKKKKCAVPRKVTLAHWLSAIAGRDSMKYAAANAPKGPSVVVGGAEGVVGEVEVEWGMTPGRTIEREIMAGATEVEPSAIFQSLTPANFSSPFVPASAISFSQPFAFASDTGQDTVK
jgi:hypothetical protein